MDYQKNPIKNFTKPHDRFIVKVQQGEHTREEFLSLLSETLRTVPAFQKFIIIGINAAKDNRRG